MATHGPFGRSASCRSVTHSGGFIKVEEKKNLESLGLRPFRAQRTGNLKYLARQQGKHPRARVEVAAKIGRNTAFGWPSADREQRWR
jgi:hypothetical protein